MKKLFLFLFFCFSAGSVWCQEYAPVNEGSEIKFTVKNFGFNSSGTFSGLEGVIVFDPENPAGAKFDVSIDASSINTGIDSRDDHLKKEDYFDVQNYHRIHFVSSKIVAGGKGMYTVTGMLTIKKTAKEISFSFSATPANNEITFKGEFRINRKDYGVGGSNTISDNVTVSLLVVARKK